MKTAIVTGGGTGIGAATCRHLAASGWRVIAGGLDQDDDFPEGVEFVRTDVTDVAFENDDRSQKLTPLSVGFSNIHAAQLPLPGAAHNGEATPSRVATVILPPSQINANGATKLHVRYRVFGIPREADITFVAGTEDSRFARNVLESMPSSWVAF